MKDKKMNYIKTELSLGIKEKISMLHISDTHLTYADERDDEAKNTLARERRKIFPEAEDCLEEIHEYAVSSGVPIVCTGDLLDFVSYANLDAAKAFIDNNDVFFAAGNHEFSLYVGEVFLEDKAYRDQSLDRVQACFKNDIRFSSRKIGGVKLIAVDNGYYKFEAEQLEALKREVSEGLPIILFMHTPLYEPKLFELMMEDNNSGLICSVPKELMTGYPERRYIQQLADDVTIETAEYIKSEPLIKAIFAGHLHFDYENELRPGLMQYVTGKTSIREIIIS